MFNDDCNNNYGYYYQDIWVVGAMYNVVSVNL